jgi:hypothetical protein
LFESGPPQDCPKPRKQFPKDDGLGEVVVRSGIERPNLLVQFVANRHHHDSRARDQWANPPAHLRPAHSGNTTVEQDQVEWLLPHPLDRGLSVRGFLHQVSDCRERDGEGPAQRGFVVHHEHADWFGGHL